MGERRFIIILLILFLNFLGTIFVIFQKHATGFYAHFAISIFFLLAGTIVLIGIYKDRPWTYQIGMLLFAALLLHLLLLRYLAGSLIRLAALVIVDVAGFLICLGSLESYEERKLRLKGNEKAKADEPKVEVYDGKAEESKDIPINKDKQEKKQRKRKKK